MKRKPDCFPVNRKSERLIAASVSPCALCGEKPFSRDPQPYARIFSANFFSNFRSFGAITNWQYGCVALLS